MILLDTNIYLITKNMGRIFTSSQYMVVETQITHGEVAFKPQQSRAEGLQRHRDMQA